MDMQAQIEKKLRKHIADISHLVVEDETTKHNVPPDAQSHFKLTVVSDIFEGISLIERHRTINNVLANELKNHIHALALNTLTVKEWNAKGTVKQTPPCLGGSKIKNCN